MKHSYFFYRNLFFFVLFFFLSSGVYAQSIISGKVVDGKTGEPLTGATVMLEGNGIKQFTSAKLNGSYNFKNLTVGSYSISAKFIGYLVSKIYQAEVRSAGTNVTVNIYLQDASTQISEVVVSGKTDKETDRSARGIEKNSNTILNVLSANTIQLLPDVTVGNALQRVSGVTIQRTSTGEGRYAIIRGMDQRYNNTLVNGIKIPSPDDRYRFIPMDIFPSEMLERLEVIKALTPNMEGDAIGGTMNLVMKSAPDRFTISANASGGFSTIFNNGRPFTGFSANGLNRQAPSEINGDNYAATYPNDFNNSGITSNKNQSHPLNSTMGLTIGDRFLDHKLGVVVSASYQNIYRGSNSFQLTPNAQPTTANVAQFSDSYSRLYSTQTERLGLHNKIDYIINSRNKISLYNLYLRTNEYSSRFSADTTGLGLNSTAQSKQVTIQNRNTYTQQNVYNGTLQGNHQLSSTLKFDWTGAYSIAKRDQPDRTTFGFDQNTAVNAQGLITSRDSNNVTLSHHWERNSDQDLSGYGVFTYSPKIAGETVEFQLGGMDRHKSRSAYYNQYDFTSKASNALYHGDVNAVAFTFKTANNALGSYNTASTNDYNVTEDVNAEFFQFKFNLFTALQVLGGVRVESTLQKYTTNEPITFIARAGTFAYTDVLPSLHLKYALTPFQNLRASYFASISRPGYGEVVPYSIDGDYFTEQGNPNLKHATADNYDFRYEFFPGGADQLLLGVFYKNITNPIEYFLSRDPAKTSALDIQPQNASGGAKNYGFEAAITKYFGIIGFSANYTYTHSRVQDTKLIYVTDAAGNNPTPQPINESRPLQGQADNVGNISALFKSEKLGLDMQVAFVYTGERLAQVSTYYGFDYYYHPFSQLDFSFEKKIVHRLSVYGKVNNLTNTANKIYLKTPYTAIQQKQQEFLGPQDIASQTLVQSDYYKLSFLAGLRYKF